MQRISLRHRAMINRELDERDPSLINLPIPVPSVPILSPLLNPIVGGNNGGTSPAPTPTPIPTPTSTSGGGASGGGSKGGGSSGGGSGTGGGSGGGTGGGSGGGTGGGSGGGTGGGSGSGTGGGGGSGTGGGSGSGSGSGNGNGNGSGGGSGGGGGSGSTTGSGSTVTTTPAPALAPGSSPIALASSPLPSAVTGPSSAPPGGTPLNSNGQVDPNGGVPQNVQGTPTLPSSTGNPKAFSGVSLQSSSTYTGVGGSPSDPSAATPTIAAASSHQLSSGAIGGIILVCLLFLIGLIVVLVRRRSIARRIERRKQWWFGRNGSSSSFSVIGGSVQDSQGDGVPSPNRASARSSFATNFDQGLMFRIDSPTSLPNIDYLTLGTIPEFPPMAEVRERASFLFPSAGAVARRESLNSMTSNGSDPDTQYLVISNDLNPPGLSSPMSVRPFSPSESFAFPKPPPCAEENKAPASSTFGSNSHDLTSPVSSTTTLIQIHSPPPIFNSDLSPSTLPLNGVLSSSTAIFNTSSNPFADPAKPESYDLETIRRPFTRTLDDELSISIGDQVRVMKVFDDGWAFVEKQGGPVDRSENGLIPVDCLREAGQALPAFLAQKRVSSYGADIGQLAQMLAVSMP